MDQCAEVPWRFQPTSILHAAEAILQENYSPNGNQYISRKYTDTGGQKCFFAA